MAYILLPIFHKYNDIKECITVILTLSEYKGISFYF